MFDDISEYDKRFARIFRMNVERRSRTAKGRDEGSKTSSSKKPLLLQGDALKAKVAENVERLIVQALSIQRDQSVRHFEGSGQRELCEKLFDIANDGLYGPGSYADEFEKLRVSAERLTQLIDVTRFAGIGFAVNPRYRLWTPAYTTYLVPPVLLEQAMDAFYDEVGYQLQDLPENDPEYEEDAGEPYPLEQVAKVLAYIDVMQDGEIHPWMDGCGRVSTAHVMWVCAAFGVDPPLFAPTKDEHYANIRDLEAHTQYYLKCFERAKAECP